MVPQPLATTRKKGMEKKTSEGVILEVIEPMKNVERVTQPMEVALNVKTYPHT